MIFKTNLLDKNSSIGIDIGTVAEIFDSFMSIEGIVLDKRFPKLETNITNSI